MIKELASFSISLEYIIEIYISTAGNINIPYVIEQKIRRFKTLFDNRQNPELLFAEAYGENQDRDWKTKYLEI